MMIKYGVAQTEISKTAQVVKQVKEAQLKAWYEKERQEKDKVCIVQERKD